MWYFQAKIFQFHKEIITISKETESNCFPKKKNVVWLKLVLSLTLISTDNVNIVCFQGGHRLAHRSPEIILPIPEVIPEIPEDLHHHHFPEFQELKWSEFRKFRRK